MPAISATLINSNPQEVSPEAWDAACMDVFDICVEKSPVDTGAFQDAWEMYRLAPDIYQIINPLEYASFLEDGWSSQAPNGVLEQAVQQLPSILRGYIGHKPYGAVTVSISIPDYVSASSPVEDL
jgi:hypothetical protein